MECDTVEWFLVAHEGLLWTLQWTLCYHKRWGMSQVWARVFDTRGLRFVVLRRHTSYSVSVRWWPKETNETTELNVALGVHRFHPNKRDKHSCISMNYWSGTRLKLTLIINSQIGFMPLPRVIKTYSDRDCRTSQIWELASRWRWIARFTLVASCTES
jgi:hypothetical protein